MATYSKQTLQPTAGTSTYGVPIPVTGTSSASPTTIHTTGSSATAFDEVWLYATNTASSATTLTVQFGGTSGSQTTTNQIQLTIPSNSGLTLVIPGLILSNSNQVTAYASVTGINISGYVNRVQ